MGVVNTPEILNNNTGETLSPSSSTTPTSPVVSPQKTQTTPSTPDNRNFITLSPTSTSVIPAPNNISCNAGSNGESPQRAVVRNERRRQEERRDGSSRRRSGRSNRNSGTGQGNTSANNNNSKLDLPPGYGKEIVN